MVSLISQISSIGIFPELIPSPPLVPLPPPVVESQEKGGANMDVSLINDLNRFFDVFNARTEESLRRNLPSESANIASMAVSDEVKLLRESILARLEDHLNR